MISLAIDKVQTIQSKYSKDIDKQYERSLNKLEKLLIVTTIKRDIKYLEKIIARFKSNPGILTDPPSMLKKHKAEIGKVPKVRILDSDGKWIVKDSPIKDDIIEALNYTYLRSSFYPKYFSGFGVKTCVYCNAQLAVTVNAQHGLSSRFDVDHFLPKDTYPWLSISLFNLYPSCRPCNNAKKTKEVGFELYTDSARNLSKSKYVFKLSIGSKATYLNSRDIDDINCIFEEPKAKKGKSTFDELFNIQKVYETQSDIVEELILKSLMYDDDYRKILKKNYGKIGITDVSIDRIILGNYTAQREIHKRPLSKFMQDIARDLELIK